MYWYQALVVMSFSVFISNGYGLLENYPTIPTTYLSLGFLLFGLGEWLNHPLQAKVIRGYIGHGHPRKSNFFGILLVIFGLIFILRGVYFLF